MSNKVRRYAVPVFIGLILGTLVALVPGCGTIKGISSDMHYMADGIGRAMSDQRENDIGR